jgi:CDP-diglyceride synthetase
MLDAAPDWPTFSGLMALFGAFLALGFAMKAGAERFRVATGAPNGPGRGDASPGLPRGPGIARKFKVFFLFQTALIALAYWWLHGLALFFLVLFGLSVREILSLRGREYPPGYGFKSVPSYGLLILFGLSLAAYLLFAARILGRPFPPSGGLPFLALAFLLVAVADGYSQITGQIFGGPKITPRISPGKTWSGFLGGAGFCAAAAWLVNGVLFDFMPGGQAFAMGACIGCLAFLGDISASWVKRRMGIKDFSGLLGPQGGALDRVDSLIWLGPALWLASRLLQAGPAGAPHF